MSSIQSTNSVRSLTSLRPYQQDAISFLYEHNAALLLLRMGGGKTVVAMTAAAELLADGEVESVLIVAPKAVALNTWASEPACWTHTADLDVGICWGTAPRRRAVMDYGHTVTVVTFDTLQWLAAEYADRTWDLIIIDEITRFNRAGGKRFKAFWPFLQRATARWGLTGSLASNHLEHIFNPVRAVDLGETLGTSVTAFRHRHFFKAGFNWVAGVGEAERVASSIRHLVFQPDPAVYQSQLPPVVVQTHEYDVGREAAAAYRTLTEEYVLQCGRDQVVSVASAGVLVSKLQQCVSGFLYDEAGEVVRMDSDRLDLLQELVAEAGEPVVVFYWFQETGRVLRSLGYQDLVAELDAWNAGDVPVAMAQPAGAGHGLNAQMGGRRIIWLEHVYSNEMREQADARLHRQGQQDTVFIHELVGMIEGKKGIDDAILQSQRDKQSTAATVCEVLL